MYIHIIIGKHSKIDALLEELQLTDYITGKSTIFLIFAAVVLSSLFSVHTFLLINNLKDFLDCPHNISHLYLLINLLCPLNI